LAGPLAGIRVVDFGLAVAGPWAAQMLADLGADVIKVDPARQAFWLPTHMATGVNRSKRSIGVDMKAPGGTEVAYDLVRRADVVVFNMRPQAAAKLGLDYESLRRINPRVVYCHTRGHEDGPRSLLPGNDQTANALAGTEWEDGGGANGGRPWFGVTSGGDLGNGFLAAIAVVAALYDRERTGRGQQVDASILNAGLLNNSRVRTTREGRSFDRPRLDAEQLGLSALYRLYTCQPVQDERDEAAWLCLAAVAPSHWDALTTVVPELAGDPRFATAVSRRTNDAALSEVLAGALRTGPAGKWFEVLDAAGVPCELCDPTFSQRLFDDQELIERGWVVGLDGNPILGHIDMFGAGIDFSGTPATPGGPPPVMWQHTVEVLSELGYDAAKIDGLRASGAVLTTPEP
jgi:crotonobetainyl-CoA:carnitine CoA-transferase CaiB-like acyl-CoA transferase